jgi:hypothetical protein
MDPAGGHLPTPSAIAELMGTGDEAIWRIFWDNFLVMLPMGIGAVGVCQLQQHPQKMRNPTDPANHHP